MNLSLCLVSEMYRNELISLLSEDFEKGLQWNFNGSTDPSEIIDSFFTINENDGLSWIVFENSSITGVFSIYPKNNDDIQGLWTKTHIFSNFRGRGINEAVKMSAAFACGLFGERLYSLVMKRNERSMKAAVKTGTPVKELDTYTLFRIIPSFSSPSLVFQFEKDLMKMREFEKD